jgi:anti-sigma B factor antagonist
MDVMETRNGEAVIIEPRGRIDSNSAKSFEEKLLGAVAPQAPVLVVDCGHLEYISSAGLRVLLMAAKRVKAAKGRMALAGLKPHVQEVFDVSGFSSIFTIQPNRAAALESVRGG